MALRFRKSITICKGVRVNVTKKGIGIGVGVNGARMSMHSTGSKSASVGIPGTGLYYYTSSGGGNRTNRKASNRSATGNVNRTVIHESGTVYTYTPEDVNRFQLLIQMLTESFKERHLHWIGSR